MANREGGTIPEYSPSDYRDAKVRNERCFLPYDDDAERYDGTYILPPVTHADREGHDIVHAVVTAFGGRYQKARRCTYPPKSVWNSSVKSLIKTLTTRTHQEADWSIQSISEAISEVGIGLVHDEGHPEEYASKYRDLRLRPYIVDDSNTYDDVCDEIWENGPIIGLIQPESTYFGNWSSKAARESVYAVADHAESDHAANRYAVTLIGTSYFDDGTRYFIAQNCWGENWGDKGRFRVLASEVIQFFIPVIPGYN